MAERAPIIECVADTASPRGGCPMRDDTMLSPRLALVATENGLNLKRGKVAQYRARF